MAEEESQNPQPDAPDDAEEPAPQSEPPSEPKDEAAPDAPADAAAEGGAPAESAQEGEGQQPSLQEIIARQRARLQAKKAKQEAEQAEAEKQREAAEAEKTQAQAPAGAALSAGSPLLRPRFVQGVLLVNTVLIAVIGFVLIWHFVWGLPGGATPAPVSAGTAPQPDAPEEPSEPDEPAPASMSWARAEKALDRGEYELALSGYLHLLDKATRTPADSLVADVLTFRRGYCLRQLGRKSSARKWLRAGTSSDSPVVRAASWYQLAEMDLSGGQFLHGRTKAYLAMASLGAVGEPLPMELDCDYLAARALAMKVLSMYGQQEAVQWRAPRWKDPFAGLTDAELRERVASGAERLDRALLGPEVQRDADETRRAWSVTAAGAHLDELLARFGSQAGIEVQWVNVRPEVRRRAVTVFTSGASDGRVAEVISGAAGLIARFSGEQIDIYDPAGFDSLSESRDLLVREANSCWRRFFLRQRDAGDPRGPLGRYALAVVQELSGDTLGAMKEYQLIAGRFDAHRVAPEALLRCARLRMELTNYEGARNDLQRLLDLHPDFQAQDEVYLALGEANRRQGRHNDAISDFHKLWTQNLSAESRARAALGVGRCHYAKGLHEKADKWLTRYIGTAAEGDEALTEAYLLRGFSRRELGRPELAEADLRRALGTDPSREQYLSVALALSELYLDTGKTVQALGTLRSLDVDAVPAERLARYLLLLGRMYRQMGLPERGVRRLSEYVASAGDIQSRARVGIEIARCHRAAGHHEAARQALTEVLEKMAPCEAYYGAACDLAEACLELGEAAQTITLAQGVLDADSGPDARERALGLLGAAYALRHDYRKAALAYSDMLDAKTGEKPE